MSKTLHLIRHAKSSWDDSNLADIDRPLNKRGKRDCKLMGKPINDAGCDFSNIYCSPALRARLTIQGLTRDIKNQNSECHIDPDLYTFDFQDLFKWCQNLNNGQHSIVIVGHNPALTDLCHYLIDNSEIDNVPTCAYVQISLSCLNWKDISKGCGTLIAFIKPKHLLSKD